VRLGENARRCVKYTREEDIPSYKDLGPVVKGLGFELVELLVAKQRNGGVQARLVITGQGSVGINDCARVHNAIYSRLEVLFGTQDISLEVGSPGIDRALKDAREFRPFLGKGAKVMRSGTSDWVGGRISGADDSRLVLATREGDLEIPYGEVLKAKLDYAEEAK
jgi:ribosome maturation factor RimP